MVKYYEPLSDPELNNETNFFVAGAAGIASGIIKVPEGIVSLAAELIDMGAGTDVAADVEQFFDKINPFEEIADDRAIGKLTEALIQIGVPGGIGFKMGQKMASRALAAKRKGKYVNLKNPNLQKAVGKAGELNKKAKFQRFAAGVTGGVAGETFVADVEDIGTIGDVAGWGPTQLDREEGTTDRGEALRKLTNRAKFAGESFLLTPFVYGVGTGAKALAKRGKDLAYSNSRIDQWADKVGGSFRARGRKPQELFESKMQEQGRKMADAHRATELVKQIDVQVNKMFPTFQQVANKSNQAEKAAFLKQVDELMFEGNIRGPLNKNAQAGVSKAMKVKGLSTTDQNALFKSVLDARKEFSKLLDMAAQPSAPGVVKTNVKELEEIMGDRVKEYLGSTYKIFENKSSIPFANYKPTDQAMQNAKNLFMRYGKRNKNPISDQEAQYMVDEVLRTAKQTNPKTTLPFFKYNNLTQGADDATTLKTFAQTVSKGKYFTDRGAKADVIGKGSKVFRELFGEIEDPRYSIYNAMTKLSGVARKNQLLADLVKQNDSAIAAGKRGFFYSDRTQAIKNLPNNEIVDLDSYLSPMMKDGNLVNPLKGYYTTKDIAEGLGNANNLQKLLRGERAGANLPEKGVTWMYRNLLLYPKGLSQISKTVLSIPTHIRNFFSAGAFAAANGVYFTNPKIMANAFKNAFGNIQVGTRGELANREYRELLELGVVNSQVQIGDLKNLLRDVKFGESVQNVDSVLKPFMNKLKQVGKFAQDAYVAEDDFWKMTNYAVELDRLGAAYAKAGIKRTPRALKEEAADIVRNTVPNYAYVSDTVRALRALPFGNFMSFPSEIIRTTTNIAKRGLREIRDPITGKINPITSTNPLKGIGFKRLAGMGMTLAAVPYVATKGAQALYNVTNEELGALRRFLPEWSKNSTIIPVRTDDGELKYIDFSHSNAYDTVSRPFNTLMNNIQQGIEDEEVLMQGFLRGVNEAAGELADPFISESIFTEALVDLSFRGGRTADGRQLYTDETSEGDKKAIQMLHLAKALAPSPKSYQRIYQAATDTPGRRGETYELPDEVLGFMGFRPIKVDPLDTMGFKISEYQDGIRNARREFTGGVFGLLAGGQKTPNDVIQRYIASNRARFKVQKNMMKNIRAAEILGTDPGEMRREFKDRQISPRNYRKLEDGMFDPFYPSRDIQARFREIAEDIGGYNPFEEARETIRELFQEFKDMSLDDMWDIPVEEFIFEDEQISAAPLPPTPTPVLQPKTAQLNPITGLTRTEQALLSPEEQVIARRT
jgi:hypothetical protein